MPPAIPFPTIRARSLANVLADLKHARRDWEDAISTLGDDAEDRANEADTRVDGLRAEFDVRLAEATGLSVEDFRAAYAEALI